MDVHDDVKPYSFDNADDYTMMSLIYLEVFKWNTVV